MYSMSLHYCTFNCIFLPLWKCAFQNLNHYWISHYHYFLPVWIIFRGMHLLSTSLCFLMNFFHHTLSISSSPLKYSSHQFMFSILVIFWKFPFLKSLTTLPAYRGHFDIYDVFLRKFFFLFSSSMIDCIRNHVTWNTYYLWDTYHDES